MPSGHGRAQCGDNQIEGRELCDREALGDKTCESLGLTAGRLTCNPDCKSFDRRRCGPAVTCGDDTKDEVEVCDGADLGGATCESAGFGAGDLRCESTCNAFDTRDCSRPPTCGNGQKDGIEVCDGADFGGLTCAALGVGDGNLACAADCLSTSLAGCSGGDAGVADDAEVVDMGLDAGVPDRGFAPDAVSRDAAAPDAVTPDAGFVDTGPRPIDIAAGDDHSCTVWSDGRAQCWGANGSGRSTPTAGTYTAITTGADHTCAVRTNGAVACWGSGFLGQTAAPGGAYTDVDATRNLTCALATAGTIACWGNRVAEMTPAGTYTAITAGEQFGCAIRTNGLLACWGDLSVRLAAVPSGTFTDVAGGRSHACAIASNGSVACWGADGAGQATPPAGTYTQLSAGPNHTCGRLTSGVLRCWGEDDSGQTMATNGTFDRVAAGHAHGCAIATNGDLACWGANDSGQALPP